MFPPFPHNGNTVTMTGRMMFSVTSNSREALIHTVDLEESPDWPRYKSLCDCEAWKYGDRKTCRHIHAAVSAIAHWSNVRRSIREEWIELVMTLLGIGLSFAQCLEAEPLQKLRNKTPEPKRNVRNYILPKNETRTANP